MTDVTEQLSGDDSLVPTTEGPPTQEPGPLPVTLPVLASVPVQAHRCANCQASLPDPLPRYCGQCGQETRLRPPTLLEFLQQFGGAYLSTEGALWRTLALLLWPGQLTLAYFAGRRRHYVLPLRLYLTISVVALMTLRFGTSFEPDVGVDEASAVAGKPNVQITAIDLGPGNWRAGIDGDRFFCEKLPEEMCARLRTRLTGDPKQMKIQIQEAKNRFLGHTGTAMFVLLPLFALWLKLLCWGSRRHYTEHLVFALHLHAFWFALVALAVPLTRWTNGTGPILGLLAMAYPLVAMNRVYGPRWWATTMRALAIAMLHGLTIGLALGGVLLATILS